MSFGSLEIARYFSCFVRKFLSGLGVVILFFVEWAVELGRVVVSEPNQRRWLPSMSMLLLVLARFLSSLKWRRP